LKRNEQHVWQARYCCVVPHSFLYYFDAHPSIANQTPQLTPKQQEMLNKAVRQGYGKRGAAKPQQPRSSLYNVLGAGAGPSTAPPLADVDPDGQGNQTLQPAGIIDLECYTTVHRNSQNQHLLELAGDNVVNPDLRSFYFCANSEEEGEDWTQSLLSERHSSLLDEKDAYRQVCDGFAQQLQVLHTQLDNSERTASNQQDELYRVRSQMEDTRRNCWRLVQDTLERNDSSVPAKKAYRTDLETIQAQDLGLLAAVQLLCDYTRVLEETCGDSGEKIQKMEKDLEQKQEGDQSKVQKLDKELEQIRREMSQQQASWQSQLETLQQKHSQSQKECQDVQKDLASQRMEMTMYQSATRTKIGELQSHKKILKKEVIELRQKLEEVNSELDLQNHKQSSTKLEVEQERQKANLLERYVEKMESQVNIQQNMMEMMSQAGSQYGGDADYQHHFEVPGSPAVRSVNMNKSYSHSPRDYASPSPLKPREFESIIVNTPSSVQNDDEDDDGIHPVNKTPKNRSGRRTIDDDNKSHMSELTEDRTQKQFIDAAYMYQHPVRPLAASPRSLQPQTSMGRPPSIIGVSEGQGDQENTPGTPKLDTIMSTHTPILHQRSNSKSRHEIPRYDMSPGMKQFPRNLGDAGSVSSYGSISKMSVAQRARIEADRKTTPVRVRLNETNTPLRGNNTSSQSLSSANKKNSSNNSQSSGFLANIGRRLEEAIDSSVLGVDMSDESSSDSYPASGYTTDTKHEEEKKTSDTMSQASTVRSDSRV
jgi:hypothetical protein